MSLPKYASKAIERGNNVSKRHCCNCKVQRFFNMSIEVPACLYCNSTEQIEIKRTLTAKKKYEIRKEAGGKCANPGCSVWRTHIHHIDEWAIYHSDNPEILIAVCPSCHDQIHHGKIEISREKLIQWKSIDRKSRPRNLHVYVEPGENIKLKAGGLWLSMAPKKTTLKLIELSPEVKIDFNSQDSRLSLVDISITDIDGNNSIKVRSNYIEILDENLFFEERTGHVRIFTKDTSKYFPIHYIRLMQQIDPQFGKNELTLLEMEVVAPGQLSLKGAWYKDGQAVVMNESSLTFVPQMSRLASKDINSSFQYTGNGTLFGTNTKEQPTTKTKAKFDKKRRKMKNKRQRKSRMKNKRK